MDAVLGTAGHIDHGKTSLVRALTGINCDRLEEERRRGITIELGFAWLDLPDGRRLGIVDVPGHERFVKNMVAGAAGIDCMMLVVAADEGIMPQTREHLDICSLLGVRHGIVALTKTDMVDSEWLEMVKEDVAAGLKGTFLEGAPVYPVSSATGAGLPELREAVYRLASSLKPRRGSDILRLPVDRVFTLKGFGTVVTGTLVSGKCGQGEDVCVMPSGRPCRARSLQVHGVSVAEAHPGQRCAMNLQNIDVADIERGDVVTTPGSLFPSRRWILWLTCLPSSPHPLKQRMEVHFHHGSRECPARILFRGIEDLPQGQSAIAEVHFPQPMAGIFGDHCVLRAHSPLRTIGGGLLLDPLPHALRKRDPQFKRKYEILRKLAQIAKGDNGSQEPAALAMMALDLRGVPGADEKRLAVLTGLPHPGLTAALKELEKEGKALCWDVEGKQWVGANAFDDSLQNCVERAEDLHKREPLKGFFAHNALCAGWRNDLPPKYTQKALEAAVKRGLLVQAGNGLKLASHDVKLSAGQERLLERIEGLFAGAGFMPPTLREIAEETGEDQKSLLPLLAHLCETGRLVKIQEGFYYPKATLDAVIEGARAWIGEHGSLDVGGMKAMRGITRKYAIPLLEYMDAIRLTYRVGNQRQLFSKGGK